MLQLPAAFKVTSNNPGAPSIPLVTADLYTLMGCKYGDDYQCHFIKGSELAVSRGDNIREKLEQMSMENERVELHQLQISDYDQLPKIFEDFAGVIEDVGMNPFKGM